MASTFVFLTLLGAGQAFEWDYFLHRLRMVDRKDPLALLELGRWCEDNRRSSWARKCYGLVLDLGDEGEPGAHFCEASLRIARIDIARRRFADAVGRLHELLGRCPGEEARELLRSVESRQTRQQVAHLERGDRSYERGDYTRSIEAYERAYRLIPEESAGIVSVPRRVILERLSRARDRHDDEYYEDHVVPVQRSIGKCRNCAARGFVTCTRCRGTRKIRVPSRITLRGRRRYIEKTCTLCRGHGFRGCGECHALGSVATVSSDERRALKKVLDKVKDPDVFKGRLDAALREVEEVLLAVKEGSTLNFFRSIPSRYLLSKNLRGILGPLPPDSSRMRSAEKAWAAARRDARVAVNFLLGYACDFARYIHDFDMLRHSGRPDTDALLGGAVERETALSPALLSAFPDEGADDVVAVEGLFETYSEVPGEHKGYLSISGEIPHKVNFFVWLPHARDAFLRLERGPWRRRVRGVTEKYPFGIGNALQGAARDHRILVVGRFLRDRLGYPRNWFEVWRFEVGLSREQDEIYRAVEEPVSEIAFHRTKLRDVAGLLRTLYAVEVEFDGVSPDSRVTITARNCPLGLLVDALARSSPGAGWYYEDGKVVLSRSVPTESAANVRAVLARLERNRPEDSAVSLAATAGSGEAGPALPDDPLGLRVLARDAVLEFRYDVAGACFEKLASLTEDARRRARIERVREKYRLFDLLTRNTPVSRLAEGSDLVELVHRTPSGQPRKTLAIVLPRSNTKELLIQEAYGRFALPTASVLRRRRIPFEEWNGSKLAALERRREELERLGDDEGRERVYKLFLLALFCKTHRLDGGTVFLEEALACDEFPWLLGTAFRTDRNYDELVGAWTGATRKTRTGAGTFARATATVDAEPVVALVDGKEPGHVEPIPDDADPEEVIRAAMRHARRGSACLRRTLEGEDAARWRRLALESFEEARRGLDRVIAARPGDVRAIDLRRDVVGMIQVVNKDLGFFDE